MAVALPRGMRDFTPAQALKRRHLFSTLQRVFEQYGFQPIETPAVELLSVLEGKYGEEGDRLLYRVLNQGDFLKDVPTEAQASAEALRSHITERGLRYDLTVPLARFMVMHRHELPLPFKRYHIAPVWRGDRPQRGRYCEFTQCDVDIIGSQSRLNEAECILIYDQALGALGLPQFTVRLNHRQLLTAMAECIGAGHNAGAFIATLDKLDKIGRTGVETELLQRGFSPDTVAALAPLFAIDGTQPAHALDQLAAWLGPHPTAQAALADVKSILQLLDPTPLQYGRLVLDPTLARGLSYYTGAILEVRAEGVQMGSIGGGGRYDNLTEAFGGPPLPGMGISFGADRIADVLDELNLWPAQAAQGTQLMVAVLSPELLPQAHTLAEGFRRKGLAVEVYADPAKPAKQFQYANQRGIPWVAVLGPDEAARQVVQLKNMTTGTQQQLSPQDVVESIRQ